MSKNEVLAFLAGSLMLIAGLVFAEPSRRRTWSGIALLVVAAALLAEVE